MLPPLNLPVSLLGVLMTVRPCFTAPTFATFCGLVAGPGRAGPPPYRGRILLGACLQRAWPHDRAHYFFSQARWRVDELGIAIARLVVEMRLPFCSRAWCLPVLARLHLPGKNAGPSKVSVAAQLVTLLAAAFGDRRLHVVADAAYHGPALRALPANVTWTCRLARTAVLYDLAPPRTGRRGRPRTKGDRLGTPADLAATATWSAHSVITYHGRTDVRHIATVGCLWYGSFHTRPVTVVLVRGEATTSGYDLALVTTDTDIAAVGGGLVTRYAHEVVVRAVPYRRAQRAGRRRGPQPHPPRGRADRPVRAAGAHPHRALVRPPRLRPGRHRRPPRRPALVRRQDRTGLRRHADQTPPYPHPRPISPATPGQPTSDEIRSVTTAWAAAAA